MKNWIITIYQRINNFSSDNLECLRVNSYLDATIMERSKIMEEKLDLGFKIMILVSVCLQELRKGHSFWQKSKTDKQKRKGKDENRPKNRADRENWTEKDKYNSRGCYQKPSAAKLAIQRTFKTEAKGNIDYMAQQHAHTFNLLGNMLIIAFLTMVHCAISSVVKFIFPGTLSGSSPWN